MVYFIVHVIVNSRMTLILMYYFSVWYTWQLCILNFCTLNAKHLHILNFVKTNLHNKSTSVVIFFSLICSKNNPCIKIWPLKVYFWSVNFGDGMLSPWHLPTIRSFSYSFKKEKKMWHLGYIFFSADHM
jgi:hypothetical protein